MNSDKKLTVLLAEDDLDDQELLCEAFQKINPEIELLSYTTGKKLLATLKNMDVTPDLIILDYNIPEMNGAEILKEIGNSNSFSHTIKIVWSTSDSPQYINSCLSLGADAYFVKPSSLSALMELAERMLSYLKR